MAFLKVPLLTPKSRWISSGELLSLSGRLPPASSSRARIYWLSSTAASAPTGCRLRAILPSARNSLM